MSTSSQPIHAPRERADSRSALARLAASPAAPWLALAALCAAAVVVILRAGKGQTFFADEWAFLLGRRGLSLDVLLSTHNEHPVTVPVVVFKALQEAFGIGHYLPYQVALIVAHLATSVFVYLYARRRLGAWLALVPAALLLFLGAAWEDLIWAFQLGFVGSVAAGVATLVALDAGRRVLACLALVVSVTSSGLGIPFLVVAAVDLGLDPRERRRSWWVVVVPAAVLAIILLGFNTGQGTGFSGPSNAIRYAVEMAAAGFGAFGGLGINWGRPLALVALLGLLYVARRDGTLTPRVIALLCGAAAFWLLTGAGRAGLGQAADASRYLYPSAVLLLALLVTVPRPPALGRWGIAAVAGATLLACVSGAGLFKQGAALRLPNTDYLLPRLTALEVARDRVAPQLQIDAQTSPDITAKDYLSARDEFGTPALSIDELRRGPEAYRQNFDSALLTALGVALTPGRAPENGAAPAVERSTGGRARSSGACTTFTPTAAAGSIELTLPAGATHTIRADAGPPVPLRLRRLAQTYGEPQFTLDAGTSATLELPRDRLADPWHLRLDVSQPVLVCGTQV